MKKTIRLLNYLVYGVKILARSFFYSQLFLSWGKKTFALGNITALKPENIRIGSNSTLNEGVFLGGLGGIFIGNNVHVSNNVILNSGYLDIDNFSQKKHKNKPIVIKDHAWLCAGAIINPGVTIGNCSVVGSGAVVTHNVPDKTVVAGVPARPIKKIIS